MRLTPEAWPGALQTVARLLGNDAAAAVARKLGGRRSYLPADPPAEHPLARILGRRAARLVAGHLVGERGDHVSWPSARTLLNSLDAEELRLAGRSVAQIATTLRMNERQVWRLVSHIPKGDAPSPTADEAVTTCAVCGHRNRRTLRPGDERQLPLPLR